MLLGRNKNGIPLRSLEGVRSESKSEVWALVADRSHLRLFQRTGERLGLIFQLRKDFAYPQGRKKGRDGFFVAGDE